jgi:hypothetical protein
MNAISSFRVDIGQNVDVEVLELAIYDALAEALPENVMVKVTHSGVKIYPTEQGMKVARKRVFGVSVQQAGDGAKQEPALVS